MPTPAPHKNGTTQWITIATPLIKRWEAYRANPYWDKGQWSHGYGTKCEKDTAPITEERASAILAAYLVGLVNKVAPLVKVKVTPNQGAALLSFSYNLGHAALGGSTLLKKLNAGDYQGAAGQFGAWVKAKDATGKKVTLPGLVKRREAERQLFLSNG
jgi:lysozyme